MSDEIKCIEIFYSEDYDSGFRMHCPNCGRFMKWNEETNEYTCVCNEIITLQGSGDKEIDKYQLDEYGKLPIRVCKKPQYYKDHEKTKEFK